jgi:hypothetical protein
MSSSAGPGKNEEGEMNKIKRTGKKSGQDSSSQ